MDYRKKTIILILFASLLRCAVACFTELGNDEVYYRMYAQQLQWNYFDHPPMVAWLIRISTINLWLDNEFFIRLGAIVSAAFTTWLFFLCGKKLSNAYTGFIAAVLYTATIYGTVISGTFILPDAPLMLFWALGLYLLIDIAVYKNINRTKVNSLIWFGVVSGLGMLCKIQFCFLWLGFLLYLLFYNREWLKKPALYIACLITLLFFFPVIKWNIDNHFVTWLYHSKRVDMAAGHFSPGSFAVFAAGQVFYSNLFIFPFFIIALVQALKNNLPLLSGPGRLLLFCSLPLILLSVIISFFKEVLPHWPAPAYSGLILLTACYFAKRKGIDNNKKRLMPMPIRLALFFLSFIITAGVVAINFYPGTIGKKTEHSFGDGDFTLDMYGWQTIKNDFEKIVQKDKQAGYMNEHTVIVSNKWFPAAHIDYYIALPLKMDLAAIGDTNEIHQYAWLNRQRKQLAKGDNAYCIVPSENDLNVKEYYAPYFEMVSDPVIIEQKRMGGICRRVSIYYLRGYLENQSLRRTPETGY